MGGDQMGLTCLRKETVIARKKFQRRHPGGTETERTENARLAQAIHHFHWVDKKV